MIRVEDEGDVRCITIARPDKRNALTTDMLASLGAAFEKTGSMRACVLLGEGPVFCAGFDLHEGAHDERMSALRDQLRGLSRTILAMRSLPCPVVVGAHGAAIAGGCALLGGADLVLADRGARFGYPVVRLGISPAITAPFLRQRVGDGAARAMLLDPGLIDAEGALRIGLVDEVLDSAEQVRHAAVARACALAGKPGVAEAQTRRWCSVLEPVEQAGEALQVSLDAIGRETFERMNREVWSR
ncbi:MAG: enoyl-CoA hydratase/isomerase family protein [Phycisphaerales bacterium]|nr:enoyl-CoA hydratase/isomerase family protein [Phycisphaerales bacterium]